MGFFIYVLKLLHLNNSHKIYSVMHDVVHHMFFVKKTHFKRKSN